MYDSCEVFNISWRWRDEVGKIHEREGKISLRWV